MNKDIRYIQILLEEAREYGLEKEVKDFAFQFKSKYPDLDLVEAYFYAYNEWIK